MLSLILIRLKCYSVQMCWAKYNSLITRLILVKTKNSRTKNDNSIMMDSSLKQLFQLAANGNQNSQWNNAVEWMKFGV